MKWTMIRPGVVRLTFDNGTFVAEFGYEGKKMLTAVNRGGTATFDLDGIEAKARELEAQGITHATVTD